MGSAICNGFGDPSSLIEKKRYCLNCKKETIHQDSVYYEMTQCKTCWHIFRLIIAQELMKQHGNPERSEISEKE